MTITKSTQTRARLRGRHRGLAAFLERESTLGYLLVLPTLVILAVFIAYPFGLGIWFSLSAKVIGQAGRFVGLENFIWLLGDQIFRQTVANTLLYTVVTVSFKLIAGLAMALLMNQQFPLKNLVRSSLLLPWIVPTALSTLAWLWIFDPSYSVVNRFLLDLGYTERIAWLGDATLAKFSVMLVNVWRGAPFFAITLLAALQMIPQDLYEAASIDGASSTQRFWRVTLPLVRPVLMLMILLTTIWTISEFQLVYILTRGGPTNSTHLFGTLSYQVAWSAGNLGEGAAVSLYMFPFLLLTIGIVLWQIRRD